MCTHFLSHPGFTGGDFMPLYLSYAATTAYAYFWHKCLPWPIDYLIRYWSIFVTTLTLYFQGLIWNLLYLSQIWSDCHNTKSKHINWTLGLKCDHRVWTWPWPWPWLFNELAIFQPKKGTLPRTESKHIEWTPGLKCDQWVRPWQWPWSLNFQGQMWPRP